MTIRRPLIIDSGVLKRLQAADGLPVGGALRYQYAGSTFGDPGSGNFGNDLFPVTYLYISKTSADSINATEYFNSVGTSPVNPKARIYMLNERTGSLAVFNVNGAPTVDTNHITIRVGEIVALSGSTGDYFSVWFVPLPRNNLAPTLNYAGTVSGDPGAGNFGFDNAPTTASFIYISKTASGSDVTAMLSELVTGTSATSAIISFSDISGADRYLSGKITEGVEFSSYYRFNWTYKASNNLADLSQCFMLLMPSRPELPLNHRVGLIWGRDGTDPVNTVNIFPGSCASDDGSVDITITASPYQKKLNATFSPGSGNGGLDTGSRSANTWYYIYAIKNPSTGASDILFSTSRTSPVLPSGYTKKRMIGAIRTLSTNLQNVIPKETQNYGIFVQYANPAENGLDINVTNLGTSRTTYSLPSVPPFPESEVQNRPIFLANVAVANATVPTYVYISHPETTDSAPSSSAAPLATISVTNSQVNIASLPLISGINGQLAARATNTSTTLRVQVLGYYWPQV